MAGETVLVVDDSPTILKVVQLVLTKAGFAVTTAPDGEDGLESARMTKPDMILLDFVMPKMNGYQFCRALAAEAELKNIPVVLMSAKGDEVGERFVKVMGIVDYLTKPFSPEAITAVVQHTIAKYGARDPSEHTQPLVEGAEDFSSDAHSSPEAETARHRAFDTLRRGIAGTIAPRVFELCRDSSDVPDIADLTDVAMTALDDDTLAGVVTDAGPELTSHAGAALEGDLQVVPLAEVLQLLALQMQWGTLSVARGRGTVDIYFRAGKVELAAAAGVAEEFLLGRFILENQLMSEQDLEAFLKSRSSKKLLGTQLVKLGYVAEADLKSVIGNQTKQLIYEILRWNFGRFSFTATRELPEMAVDAALGLDLEGILLEGFRRVDEWHLIEREIDSFDAIFLRNEDAVEQMQQGQLTREEVTILELVSGKNTVKEIIRLSRMGSFDVSKMLYRLLSIKLIRRRVMPVAV